MQKWQFFTEDQIWGGTTAGLIRDDWARIGANFARYISPSQHWPSINTS